jgi:aminodeoxyfutalosine deaminase
MPFYHAPLIFTGTEPAVLEDHIITTKNDGEILSVLPASSHQELTEITKVEGPILPGFINAHCHLELSHMKGMIPTGTGLIEFIKQVVTRRGASLDFIHQQIQRAEEEMLAAGIVAVGDISNLTDSFFQKKLGNLRYYTFVEAFDLMQEEQTATEYTRVQSVYQSLPGTDTNRKSIVPHAPYSVSNRLFRQIMENHLPGSSQSIHHQETRAEDEFVAYKKGALLEFFKGLGIDFKNFHPDGKPASARIIQNMDPDQKTLLVHNTMSKPDDLKKLEGWSPHLYWVTCPNANLYIENRLPPYNQWLEQELKICIGTDSYASNWQLNILEEMITIQKYQSYVSTLDLIRWATRNGAEALGWGQLLGTIEIGKKPGLVTIEGFDLEKRRFVPGQKARRLI